MHLKKVIMMGAAVALFAGSLLNVSAAELSTSNYAKTLTENEKDLIIDVEAYKAAYSDLAEAFGDDEDAYIEHYLTVGVFEGRTKGVLFDPLTYAAAYGDVRAAYGNNISAIVEHYITYGAAENRTIGTANGYTDIATAQKNGSPRLVLPRTGTVNSTSTYAADGSLETSSPEADANAINYDNIVANGSNYVAAPAVAANAAASNDVASPAVTTPSYHHTTSIYTNDMSTLLRVEYYDENNKLFEYSSVTYDDKDTNSYTENVYRYDEENNVQVPTRTDTYVNGELVSSEAH